LRIPRLLRPRLLLPGLLVLGAALPVGVSAAFAAPGAAALPHVGVLVPGKSLGGVRIGDTEARVKQLWGGNYRLCKDKRLCGNTTWYYLYPHGEPLGAAVKFDKTGRVVVLFTLGSPPGWRTSEGLLMSDQIDRVNELYGTTGWSVCVGYGAMTMRTGTTVTAIYTTGEAVYGFALVAPPEPVCQ